MAATKRTKIEIQKERMEIARYYLQGKSQIEIAQILSSETRKVTQQMVSYDLKIIQEGWLQSALRDFDEARAQELARIDALEREYWEAWERSKVPLKVTESERSDGNTSTKKAKIKQTDSIGNTKYLEGVQWCVERRCQLLGFDAPKKLDHSGKLNLNNYSFDVSKLTDEQLQRIIKGENPLNVISAT